jgi:hypothetical protein
MGSHSATGYVNDVPYSFHFTRELTPAWLNFVATLRGFESPADGRNVSWCELGCGQGLTATIIAGTHPNGTFHAIDAYAPHIEQARRLADRANVSNLTLHATDFAAATDLDLPRFDYIVAHGVYAWIDARGREDMRRFIDRHLAPGGLVYVSYNAMPGWASDLPFQYLLREVAERLEGDSIAQFAAGMQTIDMLNGVGAPPLAASVMVSTALKQLREQLPASYFSHEFLPKAWQPMYVTQVRADMASIGLTPVGTTHIRENFDTFVLREAARNALAMIADDNLRELARDYFLNQRFRRDVYTRGAGRIDDAERNRRMLETTFDLQRPAEQVGYVMETDAGRIIFDSEWSREIVASLGTGPKRVIDMTDDAQRRSELVGNTLALCATQGILPVSGALADVEMLNAALVALPSGTAVSVDPSLTRESDNEAETAARARWLEFIGRYGSRVEA